MQETVSISNLVDIGNNKTINVQTLRQYLQKRSNSLRLRIKFLIWDVDVELAEAFSGYAVWAVLTDILNLKHTGNHNNIYDVLFEIRPATTWAIVAGVIAFLHLTAILLDKSSEPDFDYKDPKSLQCLYTRSRMMFLALIFNSFVTLSVIVGHSYVLVWKYQIIFVAASLLSYIRLNKQYTDLVKMRKKDACNGLSALKD